ncbi:unnamed protein product [Linum trigynum]
MDCANDIQKVPDCMDQINRTVSSGYGRGGGGLPPAGGGPSPACCRVVNGLDDICWMLLFPEYFPALPAALKALCSRSSSSVPAGSSG